MSKIKIYGGRELNGVVEISGAKNAALPILCASLLCKGVTTLKSIPDISDVHQVLSIFTYLGVSYTWGDHLVIDATGLAYKTLAIEEVRKFRASYYLIGVFLSLFGKCEIYLPGGCNLGDRPLDYHLMAFRKMGYQIIETGDLLQIQRTTRPEKVLIKLPKPSVGATINILLGGVKENITLQNFAKEPEVIDTIDFLNKAGYQIITNKHLYTFTGKPKRNVTYEIIPDRIETLTYVIMALLCGNITIKNIKLLHIDRVIRELILHNANIIIKKNSLEVHRSKVEPFHFETGFYPEIPTDIQPLLAVLFLHNHGQATIKDDIFTNRFRALKELKSLGAKVDIDPPFARIEGSVLMGGMMNACDLRAAASLLVSALATNSITTISGIEVIERGYTNLYETLKSLGAKLELEG